MLFAYLEPGWKPGGFEVSHEAFINAEHIDGPGDLTAAIFYIEDAGGPGKAWYSTSAKRLESVKVPLGVLKPNAIFQDGYGALWAWWGNVEATK